MKVKKFQEFINEAKEVGILYHLLNFENLIYVADNNILEGFAFKGVSFTRNKMMNWYAGSGSSLFCKFEIDGNKLSENYKTIPKQYKTGSGLQLEEFEEYVSKKITNVFKYVNKLIFIKERENDLNYIFEDKKLWKNVKKALNIINIKYNIPFYVQEGSKITKDDKFLEKYKII